MTDKKYCGGIVLFLMQQKEKSARFLEEKKKNAN
jgi:hypothetical protein